MSKNKNKKYIDDGHTVYNMDGVQSPFAKKNSNKVDLLRKERRAAIRAAFATYLPIFLGVILCFGFAVGIIYLWLN